MWAIILISLQLLLLAYFSFFSYYILRYSFFSLKKPKIKRVRKISNKKVAVVILSFNEGAVLKDTLAACEKLTYKNKVIILADDSKDNKTFPMLLRLIQQKGAKRIYDRKLTANGSIIYEADGYALIHRKNNIGFKAGSLKDLEGYFKNRGFEYMYLLDADWQPQLDTLERALEIIEADKKIAFVQTKRISYHLDAENLQRCLALNENACYYVDLPGRQNCGDVILYSGCCTLFRLDQLYQVNGFLPGHLTEDIDLTNRFYLQGFKGVYAKDIINIGDVPHHYPAFRRQQDRWAAGTARTLKDYFWPILKSKKLNWREKFSLIRQNAYFFTALAIEASILLALLTVILLTLNSDNYSAVLYGYYLQYISLPYTIILVVALLSNFVPLIVTCYLHKRYYNLIYIPYATWLSWSMLHTYFIANLKGLLNIKQNWLLTPKLSRQKRTFNNKKKIQVPFSFKYKFINIMTLFVLALIYWLEWSYLGTADIYAFFWIPAMAIGTIFS